MTTERLSLSLRPEIAAAVREAAKASGKTISGWVEDVVADIARRQAGRAAMAEYQAELGAFTAQERAQARRVLADLGIVGADLPATG